MLLNDIRETFVNFFKTNDHQVIKSSSLVPDNDPTLMFTNSGMVQSRVKVVKNKVAPPFKQVEFDIMYGEGISKTGEIIDLGVKEGIIEKSGAWFSYGDERIGQGRENAKMYLKENENICNEIEEKIRRSYSINDDEIVDEAQDQAE